MAEEKVKLIPFTKELEEVIEADAKRCQRSFVRQVVAVLMTYYNVNNVEVDRERITILGELAPKSKTKTRFIDLEDKSTKKKKSA